MPKNVEPEANQAFRADLQIVGNMENKEAMIPRRSKQVGLECGNFIDHWPSSFNSQWHEKIKGLGMALH